MLNVQGLVVLDVDAAALNNAGLEKIQNQNVGVVKKIRKSGKEYPYVSGQAWRHWWRLTLENSFDWHPSPITKKDDNLAFTEADPIEYSDDDIFGYMRAEKDATTKKDITLTRIAPLKNTVLLGVGYNPIVSNIAVMARHEGNPVLYGKEEYTAVMKGMFSLSIDQVGTFSTANRAGYKNLNDSRIDKAKHLGATEIKDPYNSHRDTKLIRLPLETRKQRVKDTLLALKVISGGAKLATNYADVTPKIIVLAMMKSANHPFSHIVKEDLNKAVFSIPALKEAINDHKDYLQGKVHIGKREGFMDELNDDLKGLQAEGLIELGAVNDIIDRFTEALTASMS